MERDRTAALIVQAAVQNIVDFREAKINDRWWWKRLWVLLSGLDRANTFQCNVLAYQFQLAQLANSKLIDGNNADGSTVYETIQESAEQAYYAAVGKLRPWEGVDITKRRQSEFKEARQAYIDSYGVDPYDPKFQAWEAQKLKKFLADDSAGEEDQETRVTRLLRERTLADAQEKARKR